ncbi:hypothetical protein [Oscillatoria sp. HE19RPO]|uniref:hypothetical protein n=1 Tax=Oscillatoria sp. HE19RPO TaxID=2954806 RepID=UPI0020C21AE0|nr:hypothetical protein [Oscillatoria sp. HE19RPO]
MNNHQNVQTTWRRGSGLIDWNYNLFVESTLEEFLPNSSLTPLSIFGGRGLRDLPDNLVVKSPLEKFLNSHSNSPLPMGKRLARLLLTDPSIRRLWIVERIERLVKTLDDFARVEDVTVDTRSCGEETFVIEDWQGTQSRLKLRNWLTKTDDVVNIDFTLTLQCLTPGDRDIPEELAIKSGGNISIFVELDDDGELDTTTPSPIWLTFGLDVDIYAPLSWGEQRDNTKLAQLNGSRLSAFLHRLEEDIPGEFLGVDAPDYQDLVNRYGFLGVSHRP